MYYSIKVDEATYKRLKLLAAMLGKSMIQVVAEMVGRESVSKLSAHMVSSEYPQLSAPPIKEA